jgi:tetratricopeptide (TPR) repeat protein
MADTQELLLQAQSLQDAGDYYSLRRIAQWLVESATQDGDRRAIGRGLTFLGVAEMRLDDGEAARAAFEAAIEHFRAAGYTQGIAGAKMSLGALALDGYADAREARKMYEEALLLVRATGEDVPCGIALANMAEVCRLEDDLPAALRCAEEAIEKFEAGGAPWRRALALVTLAHIHSLRGDCDGAVRAMEAARPEIAASGNSTSLALYYDVYALIATAYGAVESAAYAFGFVAALREHYALTEDRGLAPWRAAAARTLAAALTRVRIEELRAAGARSSLAEIDARLARTLTDAR